MLNSGISEGNHTLGRNSNVDSLRGFAIFLVVLGHSIQYSLKDFDDNLCFRIIYSFHMPLFMFICGYVSLYSRQSKSSTFKKKALSLLIPFISWAIVKYFIQSFSAQRTDISGAKDFFLNLIFFPDNGLWFLWILFLINCIIEILRITSIKIEIGLFIAWLFLNLIYLKWPQLGSGLGLLRYHLLNFLIGIFVFRYQKRIQSNYQALLLGCSTLVFPFLCGFWYRTAPPSPITNYGLTHLEVKFFWLVFQYSCGVAGIGMSIAIIKNLGKVLPFFSESFRALGLLTLEIYAVHFYILGFVLTQLNGQKSPIEVLLIFVVVFAGTLLSIYLMKKNRFLNMFLFGKFVR